MALEQPCQRLADRLRAHGSPELASILSEVTFDGPVTGDDHLPMLIERLERISATTTLSESITIEARRLAEGAKNLPSILGRGGRVFVVWSSDRSPDTEAEGGRSTYACSWQSFEDADDRDHDLYEDGPQLDTLEQALDWARRRSDMITVRPAWDPGTHYWAGTGPTMADEPMLEMPSD